MAVTNSNCVDVTVDSAENFIIDWTLKSAATLQSLATGTTANGTWTTCVNEPFSCAELTARVSPYEVDDAAFQLSRINVVWKGIVWADAYVELDPNNNDVTIAWIGNECHNEIYRICHQYINPNTWMLDVQLTTQVSDSSEVSVFWAVYSDYISGSRGNVLQNPHSVQPYQSNTTYRSLICVEYNDGCNEFGIDQQSLLASDPIIRVNGIVKTETWNCTEGLCAGKIVTPLRGCSESLSGGAIAGIVIAAVVGAAILYLAAARLIRRKKNECSNESGQEQAQD